MKLLQDTHYGAYYIRSYEPGHMLINETWFEQSIILTPTEIISPWTPLTLEELTHEQLAPIVALKPEVVLLGTGAKLRFPSQSLLAAFYVAQIGIEVMDTHAACRTYNVLISEGRQVVAGLLIR
jgi:uncharacterized protein